MFQKLHLQLTALSVSVTGAVLAILTVICLFVSESGIRSQEYSSFQANLNALYQNMEEQVSISHNWIRQSQYHYQIALRITDNGSPLFFQQLSPEEETESLLDQAEKKAGEEYGLDLQSGRSAGILARHEEFTFKTSQGETVYASAALLPRSGGVLGVCAVHSLDDLGKHIWRQRFFFLLADLGAMAILSVFFWLFTARMLRPIRENRKKQMQFVASASHELRSPLTVILSNIAAVKSGVLSKDDAFLDTIESEGNRMSRLIGDMLQLAGADNHSWSIHPAEIELDTLLLQVWESYESLAADRGLRLEIRLPEEEVPRCVCDGERIRQLLSILIDNAFGYTPPGGAVCLTLEYGEPSSSDGGIVGISPGYGRQKLSSSSSAFLLSVSDNGPGIPDSEKEAVFERFYRADSSRKDKSHFGLGLCIAREIAELHKGRLLLSDTPGGGATFTVSLPLGRR